MTPTPEQQRFMATYDTNPDYSENDLIIDLLGTVNIRHGGAFHVFCMVQDCIASSDWNRAVLRAKRDVGR